MRRWDLLRDVTLFVTGAAFVVLELLGGLANPVLLMFGASMLGLPAFLTHSKPEPTMSAAEFEEWRRDHVRLAAAADAPPAHPALGGVTMQQAADNLRRAVGGPEPCGYCSVLNRPCACRRPKPTWTPPADPMCARGHHVASATSSTCVKCGANLFDHSMLLA